MSQRKEFHNLFDESDGLFRELGPGLTTRIFAGEHAMLSIVSIGPNQIGTMHHHPEEQDPWCGKPGHGADGGGCQREVGLRAAQRSDAAGWGGALTKA